MKPGEKQYPHVFSSFRIGKMEMKNRIKYASTETNFNYGDGWVSDKEVAYMEAQARGGAGIVTTQGAYTDPRTEGKGYVGMMAIWDDQFIPGLKRIADVIHAYDSKAILQLMHCGRVGGVELDYTVGPSVVKQKIPRFREPKEMTVEEIRDGRGRELGWHRVGRSVHVLLPEPTEQGRMLELTVRHRGEPLESLNNFSFALRDTSGWYPHAGWMDRAIYDLAFSWPEGLQLLASGELLEKGVEEGLSLIHI